MSAKNGDDSANAFARTLPGYSAALDLMKSSNPAHFYYINNNLIGSVLEYRMPMYHHETGKSITRIDIVRDMRERNLTNEVEHAILLEFFAGQ